MRRLVVAAVVFGLVLGVAAMAVPSIAARPLTERVNEAFRGVWGRNPSVAENVYWLGRVVRGDKTSFAALTGAMGYHKALGSTIGGSVAVVKSGAVVAGTTSSDSPDQMIKDVLPLFVKIYGRDPNNGEKAWWRKRIRCKEITSRKDLENSMKFHHSKGVGRGRDTICGATASSGSSSSSAGRQKVAGVSDHPMGDHVRIGIWQQGEGDQFELTVNNSYQIRSGKSEKLATLGKDDTVTISYSGGLYHVRGSGLNFDTASDDGVRIVPLNQGIVQIKNYSDKSNTIAGKDYDRFRGVVEIRKCSGCGEVWAINEVRTEYYLRGLAETSGTGPEEYIKALGAAARTYVLYHKIVTGSRKPAQGFDIGRTADDQIYRGYEYEIITPRMSSIFNKSKGTVVTNGDRLVSTIYFSDSDGRTRTAKEKWGSKNPLHDHLQKSVDDPHHQASACRGHCVGMSAQGAFGFAKADGWNYKKILSYFYKGIKIVRAY